jgi:WD40 repeat protein
MVADDKHNALPAGSTLYEGKYIIESTLGAGGFGITYRAKDGHLGRVVAIKELYPSGCDRDGNTVTLGGQYTQERWNKAVAAFLREARLLAGLDHPGIVSAYDHFEENNTAYMVMKLVEGYTLAQVVTREGVMPPKKALRYISKVGAALSVLHKRRVLHRDVKPNNIIVTRKNEPVLLDFGAAREFITEATETHTSIGTLGFSPPEQFHTKQPQGAYTDIYALAATCHYLLTGKSPRLAEPEDDARLTPTIRAALEHGLAFHAAERPKDIATFIAELNGRAKLPEAAPEGAMPVQTSPYTSPSRDKSEIPPLDAVTAHGENAEDYPETEVLSKPDSGGAGLSPSRQLIDVIEGSKLPPGRGDITLPTPGSVEQSSTEERRPVSIVRYPPPPPRYVPTSHTSPRQWQKDTDSKPATQPLLPPPPAFPARPAPAGPTPAYATPSTRPIRDKRRSSSCVAFPVVLLVAIAGLGVWWFLGRGGQPAEQLAAPTPTSTSTPSSVVTDTAPPTASPTSTQPLPSPTSDPFAISLLNHRDLVLSKYLEGTASRFLAYSPNGKYLATSEFEYNSTSSYQITVHTISAASATRQHLSGHSSYVNSVSFSPDGQTLASASDDGSVRLWDVVSGQTINIPLESSYEMATVTFSHDGQRLAASSTNGVVYLWNVSENATLPLGTITAPTPGSIELTATATFGTPTYGLTATTISVTQQVSYPVAFSPDGKTLASSSSDNLVRLWSIRDGKLLRTLRGNPGRVLILAYSPYDDNVLASGSQDGTVILWHIGDKEGSESSMALTGHRGPVYGVAFSPDGQILASGSGDSRVRLWRTDNGASLRTLTDSSYPIFGVAFAPDGRTLVAGAANDRIRIYGLRSNETPEPTSTPSFFTTATPATPTATATLTPAPDNAPPLDFPNGYKEYVVREGDTLSSIAEQELGDWERWRELRRQDGTGIGDVPDFRVGEILWIPNR